MTAMQDALALPPNTGWMPVLHQMVDSGDLAKMHPSAPAVYLVIKRHADHQTGHSSISNKVLLKESGLSKPTMYKARSSLKEFGYIDFGEKRHPTVYIVKEKLRYLTHDRAPVACSTFPFVPALLQRLLETLRSQPLTPELLQGGGLRIGTINIQINMAPQGRAATIDLPVDGESLDG